MDAVTKVRMYRGILGDCFLLRHFAEGVTTSILIDCGVLQGVKGGRDRIVEIAEDVEKVCEGKLDILVVSHEHADHISGFGHAADIFFSDRIEIGRLWLAWTENDQDERAQELRARFDKGKRALEETAKLALTPRFGMDRRVRKVAALQNFVGFDEEEEGAAAEPAAAAATAPAAPAAPPVKRRRWTGKAIIEELKSKAGARKIDYLEPGDVLSIGSGEGIRTYVLGPPRTEDRLRKDRPSGGAAKEVYLAKLDEALAVASAARAALSSPNLGVASETVAAGDDEPDPSPFAEPHRRSVERAKDGSQPLEQLYFAGPPERQIEDDWLDAAEALGLKMDSDTNNTSLVLAFELEDRQVLLFAGDAQVGNWLSWSDQTYPREARENQPRPIVVDDLLSRVTLYKVGHHASHNATLRSEGLEKMTDRRLTAMIPVVEAVAKEQGKGWNMPFPELEDRLLEKTEGRVLRGDDHRLDREKAANWNHFDLDYQDPGKGGLWVELTFPKQSGAAA